jgi:hypothetical protein
VLERDILMLGLMDYGIRISLLFVEEEVIMHKLYQNVSHHLRGEYFT